MARTRMRGFLKVFAMGLAAAVMAPASAQAAQGEFQGKAHPAKGEVTVSAKKVELSKGFESHDGPDLYVLLHRDGEPQSYKKGSYMNLGRLKKVKGAQGYAIPDGIQADAYRSVVIWCKKFDITFAYAPLK